MNSLSKEFIAVIKEKIEYEIIAKMEEYFSSSKPVIPKNFRPQLKQIERVVSYYDYYACGISVLAQMASTGDKKALFLMNNLFRNMDFYRTQIYGKVISGWNGVWHVPLRRLLFHAALAYEILKDKLPPKEINQFKKLLMQQTKVALEHNQFFHPGEKNLHLGFANNHTAIYMQAIYHVGRVLGNKQWVSLAEEAALRFLNSGHSDGYWEENTNINREGGPSLLYTPLTAGCLFDILDGNIKKQKAFYRAGKFYRSFLNSAGNSIPIADERSNHNGRSSIYGLALHSLTAEGRGHILKMLENLNWQDLSPEGLAVLYYELNLLQQGKCQKPEYQKSGNYRISLPLGVIRSNGWSAGISALRALNRVRQPNSDYALDQQNMVYLAHEKYGVILTGVKSKKDTDYSTFCIGFDGYTIDTGSLRMGSGWAEAKLMYARYEAKIRWEVGKTARLILETTDSREVTTTLPIQNKSCIHSKTPFQFISLKGFSPYTANNIEEANEAVRFQWCKKLVIEFRKGKK